MEYKEICEIATKACELCGVELNVPIKMNGRLSRTLGRVKYRQYSFGTRVEIIEFSSKYFNDPSRNDEVKHQVVLHEIAHYLAYMSDKQRHQHDEVFRYWCAKIGCTATGEYAADSSDNLVENIQVQYKYDCRCSACGNHIKYYKRYSNAVERKVSSCCRAKLDMIQLY